MPHDSVLLLGMWPAASRFWLDVVDGASRCSRSLVRRVAMPALMIIAGGGDSPTPTHPATPVARDPAVRVARHRHGVASRGRHPIDSPVAISDVHLPVLLVHRGRSLDVHVAPEPARCLA